MKTYFFKILFTMRARFNRTFLPPYPLSRKFGFDRGMPIDRFFIELFLSQNAHLIKGRVLEITDNKYTLQFGEKIAKSDVLDINKKNRKANIIGDLRNLKGVIKDNTYDTIILTHVIGMIDDVDAVTSEIYRILAPKGHVLVTAATLSPNLSANKGFWRFTAEGLSYLFSKNFRKTNIKVQSLGNYLAGQAFWMGLSQEEVDLKELAKIDPEFPCIATLIARK